jgi:hypothetical protein
MARRSLPPLARAASARPDPVFGVLPEPSEEAMMRNSAITATMNAMGSSVTTGCNRTTDPAILAAVRRRSRLSATTSCESGSGAHKPRLASCRSRRITARRCPALRPGSR